MTMPEDMRRGRGVGPTNRYSAWGWIIGIVLLLIVVWAIFIAWDRERPGDRAVPAGERQVPVEPYNPPPQPR